jgi:hypothetical protein
MERFGLAEDRIQLWTVVNMVINPLNAQLNSISHLLSLLGTHPILYVSRIRVNLAVGERRDSV